MELLYDRLGRQAFGLAYRILGDGASAEDVVQEAFLTLWRQAERLDATRGNVSSLLMTLVHHKAVDTVRSRKGLAAAQRSLDSVLERDVPDIAEGVAEAMSGQAVRRALESLPSEQRRPIEMAYFEGLTHVEIAESLNVALGTVKSRLRLGLGKLRRELTKDATR